MQAAKNAMSSAKETAANVAASARSGMEKTKATVQEKVERMSAHDPVQKDLATSKKEERINLAEQHKQEAREHNAAARQAAAAGGTQQYSAGGASMQNQNNVEHLKTGSGTQGCRAATGPVVHTESALGGGKTSSGMNPLPTDDVYPIGADAKVRENPNPGLNTGVGGCCAPTSGCRTGNAYK